MTSYLDNAAACLPELGKSAPDVDKARTLDAKYVGH